MIFPIFLIDFFRKIFKLVIKLSFPVIIQS